MTNLDHEVFNKLLQPDYPVDKMGIDTMVELAGYCVESRELFQKVMGKMVASFKGKGSVGKVRDFAEAITNNTGHRVSFSSLWTYGWVYEKLEKIMNKMPEDFSYSTWRDLAGTDSPKKWLDMALREGLTGPQLTREIQKSKGKKMKVTVCPKCGFSQEI